MPASEQKVGDPKKLPGIFISYRRSDNPDAVGRIYDRLVSEFGKARVFKDVDSIPLGQDFRSHLNDIVGNCAAVLAIVGPKWIDTRNASGQRRLEDPDDFVRIELEAALARNVPVVPVLVGHAPMPGSTELPTSLASMAFRQSIEVRPDPDFHNDATRLVSALWAIVDPDVRREVAAAGATQPKRSWVPWLVGLAAMTTLAAITFAIPALKHLRETPPLETRTEISAITHDSRGSMAISPDGKQIAFIVTDNGVSRLWLRALAATTAQPLPGTEGGSSPFWSPDSRSIGFFANNSLKRMDIGGGTPRTLAPVTNNFGGTWSAEGVMLFSQGLGKSLARIPYTGGEVTQVTHLDKEAISHVSPVFLPDGRRFVYGSSGGKAPGTYLGSLDGTSPIRLTDAYGNIAYLPSGWLLIWDESRRALIAQRLDAGKAALVGAPLTLAEGDARGAVSASANGLIAYRSATNRSGKRMLKWRSRTGSELGSIGEPNETYVSPRVSPDGRRVTVARAENGKHDIWMLDGDRASRLTFDAAGSSYPLWSPDGKRIVFGSVRDGAPGLYEKLADGSGEDRLLLKINSSFAPSSWSADGQFLIYVYLGAKTQFDLGVLPMTGGKTWTFLNSLFTDGAAEFSPDGKWVAYASNEGSRFEVFIRPFVVPGATIANPASGSGKWQVSTLGGTYPKWNPSGKELFFLNPAGELMAAPVTFSGSAPVPGAPTRLFQSGVLFGGTSHADGPQYDVARDGRFLINTVLDTATPESSPIILIQNWNPDAKN